jgi:hypothetical protein
MLFNHNLVVKYDTYKKRLYLKKKQKGCTSSSAMYEVFNPTLLVALFQFKKIGPTQMQISFKYKIV